MIDQSKTYRTRDGREVRIYATDGGKDYPVHGAILTNGEWLVETWSKNGAFYVAAAGDCDDDKSQDLIPADPHGILPRHRELLAEAFREVYGRAEMRMAFFTNIETDGFADMPGEVKAALIALARLEKEKGE